MAHVESLALGEKFEAKIGPDNEITSFMVRPSCGTNEGQWYCVTHQEPFRNNLMKDNHIGTGKHRFVWVCFNHGPETP